MNLKNYITDVPDFPIKGVIFKDITPLVGDAGAFKETVEQFAAPFKDKGITKVVGIESRGFFFAPAVAYALGAAFVPLRKPGKLPGVTVSRQYVCEYNTNKIEIHADALNEKDNVLLLDDVLATGGTAAAAAELTQSFGARIEAFIFLLELEFLDGRKNLQGLRVESLIKY